MARSVDWDDEGVMAVDQRALPGEYRILCLATVDEVVDAIATLAIRGAPALGAAGALGVALAARHHLSDTGAGEDAVRADAERLIAVRPTAANLAWGVRRALCRLPEDAGAVLEEALEVLAENEQANRSAAKRAAGHVLHLCGRRQLRMLTHCNTGRLAAVGPGTALGAIGELARMGFVEEVLVGETRPLLQGARLTTWELAEARIPHRLCVDAAGPAAIAGGLVDCVIVGADRIAANGDVANKIGTYALAVAAARQGVPFLVVAPESTRDETLRTGRDIRIEQRAPDEIFAYADRPVAPPGTRVYNPAFDVTPTELVTAIVTDRGVYHGADAAPESGHLGDSPHEGAQASATEAEGGDRGVERCRSPARCPSQGTLPAGLDGGNRRKLVRTAGRRQLGPDHGEWAKQG